LRTRRRRHVIAWAGALFLLALHLDAWRPQRVELWFGWLPEEMAWRLAWMAIAWVYLLWFCSAVWAADEASGDDGAAAP
jgi:hypothetical protein